MRLKGKVAVITGGNSGIGLATARLFIEEGAQVAILGRDPKTLAAAGKELGGRAIALQTDVGSVTEIEAAATAVAARFGKIDMLFANAGVAEFRPLEQIDENFFDKTFDINVKGLFFATQKFAPLLRDGGAVLFTSSVMGRKGSPGASVYGASKAAVRSLGRSLAAELIGRKIRVNVLSPGPIETPIFGRLNLPADTVKAMTDHIVAENPMRRLGSAEEMAKVALFLLGDDSSYITGAEIGADGGSGQL